MFGWWYRVLDIMITTWNYHHSYTAANDETCLVDRTHSKLFLDMTGSNTCNTCK